MSLLNQYLILSSTFFSKTILHDYYHLHLETYKKDADMIELHVIKDMIVILKNIIRKSEKFPGFNISN